MNRHLACLMICLGCLLMHLSGCKDDDPIPNPGGSSDQPNILLIIADDVGKDPMNGYSEGNRKASTPVLDELRTNGLEFSNFWSNPVCSPTRSTILTGKYGYHTGVLTAGGIIDPNENTLQSALSNGTNNAYSTAIIGKWHLSNNAMNEHPLDMGIDYYAGMWGGGVQDYYNWTLTENRTQSQETSYTTTKLTDLGIDWINDQSKPWFLWMAYNAAHTPFHLPPSELTSANNLTGDSTDIADNPLRYYLASIEAMDTEIGRMLNSLDAETRENTIILYIGDNGTPGQVSQAPYRNNGAKGSLYQGGVNNPMFVSGKGVERTGSEDALVNSSDFFVSLLNIAGSPTSAQNNSVDFSSLLTNEGEGERSFAYAESNEGVLAGWCIRNTEYKLIVKAGGEEHFFNLKDDPYEENDLLLGNLSAELAAAKELLETEAANIRQ